MTRLCLIAALARNAEIGHNSSATITLCYIPPPSLLT